MFNFLFVIFISSVSASEFIAWNVGQGQWITEVQSGFCLHYDTGGERNPSRQVLELCSRKLNLVHLSHWDWDHVSFLQSFAARTPRLCLIPPHTPPPRPEKFKWLQRIQKCSENEMRLLKEHFKVVHSPRETQSSNDSSQIVYSKTFQTLIPGDSTKKQEKIWRFKTPSTAQGLILGHHGSRTSTSKELLQTLPNLKWAIASARYEKYRHPHKDVLKNLKAHRIPILKTEDWGHIRIQKTNKPQK